MPEILLSREQIAVRIAEVGQQITADFAGQFDLLVGVLMCAWIFLGDLARHFQLDCAFDFIAVRSYSSHLQSTGEVQLIKDVTMPLRNQNVILVEDILDTGLTMTFLKKMLMAHQPLALKTAALLDKPSRRVLPIEADYTGFLIPDRFVIGYGLDYAERYRNLPDLCVLAEAPSK